jgi:hypothetical protein
MVESALLSGIYVRSVDITCFEGSPIPASQSLRNCDLPHPKFCALTLAGTLVNKNATRKVPGKPQPLAPDAFGQVQAPGRDL